MLKKVVFLDGIQILQATNSKGTEGTTSAQPDETSSQHKHDRTGGLSSIVRGSYTEHLVEIHN